MNILSILTLLVTLLSLTSSQTYATTYVLTQYRYSDGGSSSSFSSNPTFIPRLTTNSFVLYLTAGTNTVFNLARGLYSGDQSLFPLGGFSCTYTLSGLPSWATFDSNTAVLTANTPSSFTTINFTISYSDSRNNANSIPASFVN